MTAFKEAITLSDRICYAAYFYIFIVVMTYNWSDVFFKWNGNIKWLLSWQLCKVHLLLKEWLTGHSEIEIDLVLIKCNKFKSMEYYTLWKETLNSDNQQFYQYHQNENITSHPNSLNIIKGQDIWRWKSKSWPGQAHISGVVKPIDWLLIISLLTFEYVILK
jgi:hypothetical protein